MKRFFCTICGRVKRVRKYPANVSSVDTMPEYRIGECARHSIISVPVIKARVEVNIPVKALKNKRRA